MLNVYEWRYAGGYGEGIILIAAESEEQAKKIYELNPSYSYYEFEGLYDHNLKYDGVPGEIMNISYIE